MKDKMYNSPNKNNNNRDKATEPSSQGLVTATEMADPSEGEALLSIRDALVSRK